ERPEGRAAGTLAEPTARAIAAFGAAELNGRRLRHGSTLRSRADANLARSSRLGAKTTTAPPRGAAAVLRGKSGAPAASGLTDMCSTQRIILRRPRLTRPLSGGSSRRFTVKRV